MVERFLAILIEHYAGEFPLWLAPEQVTVIPISDKHLSYADEVKKKLTSKGFRVNVDDRAEKMGLKIRESEKQKVPFMMIVGDQEVEKQLVSVRKRKAGNLGQLKLDEVLDALGKEL